MPEMNLPGSLYLVLGFLVPGFIVLVVRSQFLTGRSTSNWDTGLSYLTVSLIYYALILPFLRFVQPMDEFSLGKSLVWFIIVLVGPALFGALMGMVAQKDLLRSWLRRCGLNPLHAIDTAWDWKFLGLEEQWVLVTLKDGTRFAGFCGSESFISSDPAERDIYIQAIYDVGADDTWSSRGQNGVLIGPNQVRTIEFWPYQPAGGRDGEQ